MDESIWTAVDGYFAARLAPSDEALEACLRASIDAALPAISVSPLQGKLLMMLARLRGATSILEIGTLGGYSTIWLARALPTEGRLVSLEIDPARADLARANVARAGLADRDDILVGPAAETLARFVADGTMKFDFVFIDADKRSTPEYFERALALAVPGAVIVVDNVVRRGAVADASSEDEDVGGIQRFIERLATHPSVVATAIQTVGAKGYDGFVIATVNLGNPESTRAAGSVA